MDSIDIFLVDPVVGTLFQFPVNPSEMEARGEAVLETVEIVRLGEVDWVAGKRLTQLAWDSFFPGAYDPHYCRYVSIPDPLDARQRLITWRTAGTVLRLIITGIHKGARKEIINAPVIISVFSPKFKGGEPDDIYYSITLREYTAVQIRTTAEVVDGAPAPNRLDIAPVPSQYIVQPGDTLYLIAKTQLGSGERWNEIYSLNQAAIGPDPNLIQVGAVLTLPGAGAPPQTVPPAIATSELQRYTTAQLAYARLHDPGAAE